MIGSVLRLLPQSETMEDGDLEDWLRINYNIMNPNEVILPALTDCNLCSLSRSLTLPPLTLAFPNQV